MAKYNLVLPSMGEGVMEATITGWLKQKGDYVEENESIVEVATDKVDSDVPSEVSGTIIEIKKDINDVVQVGEVIAVLEVEGNEEENNLTEDTNTEEISEETLQEIPSINQLNDKKEDIKYSSEENNSFLSPLVKTIIKEEKISNEELNSIQGSGLDGRITKEDIKQYLQNRNSKQVSASNTELKKESNTKSTEEPKSSKIIVSPNDEIIEMDRMRSLISNYMVESKKISPHVTSFIEADVTNLVLWRNKNKDNFEKRTGEKLTFTPLFVQAIVKAIQDFPMINISVVENKIIKKKNINIGIATALPSGNLIVPVVKNADELSISGLAKAINSLVYKARNNKLSPSDITEGTYTVTNIGTFGNTMGTPIINQPQVAIMAVGTIQKKVSVIETPTGDTIGIRSKMHLSHTYDHRVVDGSLGGMFLKRVSDYLESFDINSEV
ncbi:MAG: 2-oxo acid dehydrogenase subunit E2 [Flavobacteriales bacterium]|nr:2-oxo acid dehydrogenase subunit E2 [Flavobacteriales bacterium]